MVNPDPLVYTGNRDTFAAVEGHPLRVFVHGEIGDRALVAQPLGKIGYGEYLRKIFSAAIGR